MHGVQERAASLPVPPLGGAAGTGLETTGTAHGSRFRLEGAGAAYTLANKMPKPANPRKGRGLKRA